MIHKSIVKYFIFTVFLLSDTLYAFNTLEDAIAFSETEAGQNAAHLLIEGDLSYLDHNLPLDFITVSTLSPKELDLLKNTIYARHGYIFESSDLREHFEKFDWYTSSHKNIDSLLTKMDKINLNLINGFLVIPSQKHNLPDEKELSGLWHISLFMPSGFSNVLQLFDDSTFIYRYSQMRQVPLINSFSGTYELKNNQLLLKSEKKTIIKHSGKAEFSGFSGYQWSDAEKVTVDFIQEYRFPFSGIHTLSDLLEKPPKGMENREVIILGSVQFYLYSKDPSDY